MDDRTREELGETPLHDGCRRVQKSRYDSTDCYIYPCSAPYNDIELEHDPAILEQLRAGGVDEPLARHIAHMFIRDPLQVGDSLSALSLLDCFKVFKERLEQDDNKSTEHFETIQSSNWMNM